MWVTFGQRVEPKVQLSQSRQLIQLCHSFEGSYAVTVKDEPLQRFQVLNPLRTKEEFKRAQSVTIKHAA